jgi:hypothetical protein
MKIILLALILLSTISCSSRGSGVSSYAIPYSKCLQVESSPTITHNCPGSPGTWNGYEIKKDSSNTVMSVEESCGESTSDHPMSQSEYDAALVPSGSFSNNDYIQGTDCVSGSNRDGVSAQTINIWQLVQ